MMQAHLHGDFVTKYFIKHVSLQNTLKAFDEYKSVQNNVFRYLKISILKVFSICYTLS